MNLKDFLHGFEQKDSPMTVPSSVVAVLASLLLMLWGTMPECDAADMDSGKRLPSFMGNQADVNQVAQAFTLDDLFEENSVDSSKPQQPFHPTASWRGFSQLEFAETIANQSMLPNYACVQNCQILVN